MKWNCEKCNQVKVRDDSYDAYLCFNCNEWTETQCSDTECNYCVGRPEKPFTDEEHYEILKVVIDELKINETVSLDSVVGTINKVLNKNNKNIFRVVE